MAVFQTIICVDAKEHLNKPPFKWIIDFKLVFIISQTNFSGIKWPKVGLFIEMIHYESTSTTVKLLDHFGINYYYFQVVIFLKIINSDQHLHRTNGLIINV